MGTGNEARRWLILRTSGGRTLPLARSLTAAGFEAWTPVAMVISRFGKARERREREAPITPTFVFVAADRLADLTQAQRDPARPHPSFSIFHHQHAAVTVRDGELGQLRAVEEREHRIAEKRRNGGKRAKAEPYATGDVVPFTHGAWAGLSGQVESSDSRTTWLTFGPTLRLKVETCVLRRDEVAHALSAA